MGASQVPQVTLTDVNGNPVTVTAGSLATTGAGGSVSGAVAIADATTSANQAKVTNQAAIDTDYGLVVRLPRRGVLTDRSGTVTVGGTAQTLIAANTSRRYLLLRNPLIATEELWFNFTTTAVADSPSIRLDPGDTFVMEDMFVTTEAISVLGATTGHKITAKEG
jgi:hypothetical protein